MDETHGVLCFHLTHERSKEVFLEGNLPAFVYPIIRQVDLDQKVNKPLAGASGRSER
jgi:hypothetical protein